MNSFVVNMPKKIHFNVSLPVVCREVMAGYKNILMILPSESMAENTVVNEVVRGFEENAVNVTIKRIPAELTIRAVEDIADELKSVAVDAVLTVGGGSIIDAGKILSVMLYGDEKVAEILSADDAVVKGRLPLYTAPSTHSSAEASGVVSVCSENPRKFKKEIRNRVFIPDEVFVDLSLTLGSPRTSSLNSMMISFVNLIEGYVSKNANPFCDALITDVFADFEKSIYDICTNDSDNASSRAVAAYASVVASISKEQCGTGVVNALANAVCSVYAVPYGAVCAALMYPAVLRCMQKVQMFAPASVATEKYARLGSLISGMDYEYDKHHVLLRRFNNNLSDMREDVKLPSLSALGVGKESFYNIVSMVLPSNSPVELAESELIDILNEAF